MNESKKEYRNHLLSIRQDAQNNYDKHLISLSGGALGVSITFIHNIVGDKPIQQTDYLLYAWILWTASISFMLFSFYTSRLAIDKAISQTDDDIPVNPVGGWWSRITSLLNILAGISFLCATIFMITFVINNLR